MRASKIDSRAPGKQDTLRLDTCLLLGSVLALTALLPSAMMGDPISITRNEGGYANTSTLGPVFQNRVSNLPSYTTYCPWVLTALASSNFTAGTGWNFTFAGPTQSQFFKNDE